MPDFNLTDDETAVLADYLSTALHSSHAASKVSEESFTPEMAERGKSFYEKKYECQSCHTIGSSGGYLGPRLNSAGDWLTPAWIDAWLRSPLALVPDTIEPRQAFSEDEIRDITAYLLTLKQAPPPQQP